MPTWSMLLLALVTGLTLLGLAIYTDRRIEKQLSGIDTPAPTRGIAAVDQHHPRYITQSEVDNTPVPTERTIPAEAFTAPSFPFGHAHPDFATSKRHCYWQSPYLLISQDPILTMRELLTTLAWSKDLGPLIVVAPDIAPEVIETLAANRRRLNISVTAARSATTDLGWLLQLTGATAFTAADLRSDYLPKEWFGQAASWASSANQSWVRPLSKPKPQPES